VLGISVVTFVAVLGSVYTICIVCIAASCWTSIVPLYTKGYFDLLAKTALIMIVSIATIPPAWCLLALVVVHPDLL